MQWFNNFFKWFLILEITCIHEDHYARIYIRLWIISYLIGLLKRYWLTFNSVFLIGMHGHYLIVRYVTSFIIENCPKETWSLQLALIHTCNMFIDKSITFNHWAFELGSTYSTLPTTTRNKMKQYAIYDCFATTYLMRPILHYWSFQ